MGFKISKTPIEAISITQKLPKEGKSLRQIQKFTTKNPTTGQHII